MTTADVDALTSHTGKIAERSAGRTVRQLSICRGDGYRVVTTAHADALVPRARGRQLNSRLNTMQVNITCRRRTCREDGSCGNTVVVHGEIAEHSQAVNGQQKTRCGRCRRSTHSVKQCAAIICVA